MPELPEVETVCRGIRPHLDQQTFRGMIVRDRRLRWPVAKGMERKVTGSVVQSVLRRGKYILIRTDRGTLMIHLGMSGRLYFVGADTPAAIHDHIDWPLSGGRVLRFTDPRRFGSVHWLPASSRGPAGEQHALLDHLGPEPLEAGFDGEWLYQRSRRRKAAVKTFIMDSRVVVGVGNIYANEALFAAGIHPNRQAGRISRARYLELADQIKKVLAKAIAEGGTTLKDFVGGDGQPGYFKQQLQVYGRAGKPCRVCGTPLTEIRLGQRSTVFCKQCQR